MGDAILRIPRDARVRAYRTRDTYDGVVPATSKRQPYCHSIYIELSSCTPQNHSVPLISRCLNLPHVTSQCNVARDWVRYAPFCFCCACRGRKWGPQHHRFITGPPTPPTKRQNGGLLSYIARYRLSLQNFSLGWHDDHLFLSEYMWNKKIDGHAKLNECIYKSASIGPWRQTDWFPRKSWLRS